MEIEKKYLVKSLPFDLNYFEKQSLSQSYISVDPVIRIRKKNDKFVLEIKGEGSFAREEFGIPLTEDQYGRLMKKSEGNEIIKDRFLIPIHDGLTAELDVYKGRLDGFMTVEVEFKTIEEGMVFTPPEWFGEDVTFDRRYKNSYLALFNPE